MKRFRELFLILCTEYQLKFVPACFHVTVETNMPNKTPFSNFHNTTKLKIMITHVKGFFNTVYAIPEM